MKLQAVLLVGITLLLSGCPGPSDGVLTGNATIAKLLINEIMLLPEEGAQWVELYNSGSEPAKLAGFSLVGSNLNVNLSDVPSIKPKEYAVVLVFGESNESIGKEKDTLTLKAAGGSVVDSVSWDFTEGFAPAEGDESTVYNGFFVAEGHSIGRDRYSTDRDIRQDWFGINGIDSLEPTPGSRNYDDIALIGDDGTFPPLEAEEASAKGTGNGGGVRLQLLSVAKPSCGTVSFQRASLASTKCDQVELLKKATRLMQETCNASLETVSTLNPDNYESGRISGSRLTEVNVTGGIRVRMGEGVTEHDRNSGGQTHFPRNQWDPVTIDLHNQSFDCNVEKLKIIFYHELVHERQLRRPNSGKYDPTGAPLPDGEFIKQSAGRIEDCYEAEAWLETMKKLQAEQAHPGSDVTGAGDIRNRLKDIKDVLDHSKKQFIKYWGEGVNATRRGCSKFLWDLQQNKTHDDKVIRNPRGLEEYARARNDYGNAWLERFHNYAFLFAEKYIRDETYGDHDGALSDSKIRRFVDFFRSFNLTNEEIVDAMRNHTNPRTLRRVADALGVYILDMDFHAPEGATVPPGTRVTYALKLSNYDNQRRQVNLTVRSSKGWVHGAPYTNALTLDPYGEADFVITENVPSDAQDGERDEIVVNANYYRDRHAVTVATTIVTRVQREHASRPTTGGDHWAFTAEETDDSTTIFLVNNGNTTDSVYIAEKDTPDAYYQYSSSVLGGKNVNDDILQLEPGESTSFTINYSPYYDTPGGEYVFRWVIASRSYMSERFTITKTINYVQPPLG